MISLGTPRPLAQAGQAKPVDMLELRPCPWTSTEHGAAFLSESPALQAVAEQPPYCPLALQTPRPSVFRRLYHFHSVPGPRGLLRADDPSRTGDHSAVSRYAGAFALQFDHLSRVVGLVPAHIFLGAAVGVIWGFGVRQGIHSMYITRRILRGLHAETAQLEAVPWQVHGPRPVYLQALLRHNHTQIRQARYLMGLDALATTGAAAIGVGTLFRYPLLGGIAHGLLPVAIPLLTAAFFPLVLPSVLGAIDGGARGAWALRRAAQMHAYLQESSTAPEVEAVDTLYRQRQHELATYAVLDALARGGLAAGAAVSVFMGPAGLLLLVPATIGVLVSESMSSRIKRVDDALPLQERLTLHTDQNCMAAIVRTHADFVSLDALRRLRKVSYPAGWGTVWRPLLRIIRWMHGRHHADPQLSAEVLAAFIRRDTEIQPVAPPDPGAVMDCLDDAHAREAFARGVLNDATLRAALRGYGVWLEGRTWSVDANLLRAYMNYLLAHPEYQTTIVDRLYELAEEALLTAGRLQTLRRQRALLDHYGRFARAARRVWRPVTAHGCD